MGFESTALVAPGPRQASRLLPRPRPAQAIGAPLEAARLRLLDLVERLSGLLGEHAAPLLEAARHQLEHRACRIAVIGQVKAGKSTFINALARRPGLLPTDINPWTVVVTALHFRTAPTPPEHAAVFHLFSVDEWRELAEGGGHLRELTERLVPGFQSELLGAQLEVMRKRAERRLGPKFPELLGQCHRYRTVTSQVLTDYVRAGDGAAWPGERRHYADVTRSADLYFHDRPVDFPITLIDTPGTNDPFLVRDEITRRSLENPDIYVFVVSALQPLSAGDIAMLRLLNGLHKDRIVVFINRADQLADPRDAMVVKAAIEKRLRLEFPTLQIPVVCGSARLGSLEALAETDDFDDFADGYAKPAGRRGLQSAIDEASGDRSITERCRAAHARIGSGLTEVSTAITGLMCTSSIAMMLRQIAVCLAELVRTADIADRAELGSIRELIEARREEAAALGKRIGEEQASLAAFEGHANALQASFTEVEAHFKELVASAGGVLRRELCALVREFADKEEGALLDTLQERPRLGAWRCDALRLRHEMEAAYLAAYEQAASDLDRVEQFLYPQLKLIVSSLLPDYGGNLLEAPAWPQAEAPAVAALGDKVTMDLGISWWRRWFAGRRAAEERVAHLRRLIDEDFLKIADDLVDEAEAHLVERVDYIMCRVNAIGNGLRAGMERRSANLASERLLLDGEGDEPCLERFEREQRERADACLQRQQAYSAALGELDTVLEALDVAHGGVRP